MSLSNLKKTQKAIKDLILFDSAWKKKNKVKGLSKHVLDRLKVYRELVRSSFIEVSKNIYPYTYKLLSKSWDKLISDYIEKYPPSSPILNRVIEHIPTYLLSRKDILSKYPFIGELARYEWLEVEIYERENISKNNYLSLNPIHEICIFHYPVPEIIEMIENNQSVKVYKQKTNVLIYRDPKDFSVRFFELSTSTMAFVDLLKSGFSTDMVIYFLANAYQVDESGYKYFEKEAKNLIKTLKQSRILV